MKKGVLNLGEESAKPCIQDRLLSAATRSKDIFASWPILFQFIILIFFLLPEILDSLLGIKGIMPILSEIPIEGRIGIIFSSSVAVFSSVQYTSAKNRNKIEDSRYVIEKVYGPLFAIISNFLNRHTSGGETSMTIEEGLKFNKIFSTYPHLISNNLFTHWYDEIRIQNLVEAGLYYLDADFVADFLIEYAGKMINYQKLIGK